MYVVVVGENDGFEVGLETVGLVVGPDVTGAAVGDGVLHCRGHLVVMLVRVEQLLHGSHSSITLQNSRTGHCRCETHSGGASVVVVVTAVENSKFNMVNRIFRCYLWQECIKFEVFLRGM